MKQRLLSITLSCVDTLKYAKEGTLEEKLEALFPELS